MLHGDLGVDPVQLIETNPVEAQPPQSPFARRLQMFRLSVFDPLVRTRPLEATLRRHEDAFRIGIQSLSNDSLAHIGAVRIRRVNEINAVLGCATSDANGLTLVSGLALSQ